MNFTNENTLKVSVIVSGFTALIVQIIFLREFLGIFMGNELVSGVIIGNWMLLTASGAMLGKWIKPRKNIFCRIIAAQLLVAILPQVSVVLLNLIKSVVYPPGVLPGFFDTWLYSFILMFPFCLVSGALFALFSEAFNQITHKQKAWLVYGFEAAGSVAGGILFTFVLLRFFSTFQILLLVSSVNFGISLVLVLTSRLKIRYFYMILIFCLCTIAANLIFDFDSLSKSFIYKKQEIVLNEETPYGNLVVTKTEKQYNFFENSLSLFSTNDLINGEESVHYAMLQHPDPKKVLLVSGGVSEMMNEILKYKVTSIDYVEINPAVIEAIKKFTGFKAPDILEIHNRDARTFISRTGKKFDVVLLNLPAPSTAQINCYFTEEFYGELKSRLSPGAIISTSLAGNSNYLGKETATFYGILVRTLKTVFKNVIILPGQLNYFLASDAPLETNIVERLEKKNFKNQYVNKYYLNDVNLRTRAFQLQQLIPQDSPVNRDFHPVAYFARIDYWLSWFGVKTQNVTGFVAIAFFVILLFLKPHNQTMFVTGFTASATEMMVLLAFQVLFGYFYMAVSLLIAAFMAGLALGTYFTGRHFMKANQTKLLINQVIIGLTALLIPLFFVIGAEKVDSTILLQFLFYVLMIIPGMLTGIQFSWVSATEGKGNTGNGVAAYSADLVGSAGGALLASIILIPLAGFITTGIILFGLNVFIIVLNLIDMNLRRIHH
jgi:spermidine synthase